MTELATRPVRFLALEWSEDWEFGHPAVVLEPVVRYSPDGGAVAMLEDLASDMCLDAEHGKAAEDEDVTREFTWRGWSLHRLRRKAQLAIDGKLTGRKHYRVTVQWVRFFLDGEGEWQSECVDPPTGVPA